MTIWRLWGTISSLYNWHLVETSCTVSTSVIWWKYQVRPPIKWHLAGTIIVMPVACRRQSANITWCVLHHVNNMTGSQISPYKDHSPQHVKMVTNSRYLSKTESLQDRCNFLDRHILGVNYIEAHRLWWKLFILSYGNLYRVHSLCSSMAPVSLDNAYTGHFLYLHTCLFLFITTRSYQSDIVEPLFWDCTESLLKCGMVFCNAYIDIYQL